MNDIELRPLAHCVESVASIQSIFNHAGDYSERLFNHKLNGSEGSKFFPLFSRESLISTLNVYEIILKGPLSVSIGLVATKHFPAAEQSFISLILVDCRYRRQGVGTKSIKKLEAMMSAHSKFASLKVALSNQQACDFWKGIGYVDESEMPESVMPIADLDKGFVRLVKRLSVSGV